MEQVQPNMIKAEDIPHDVQWVWCLQWGGYPVGLDTWEKVNAIIKANPEYFPWETKYNSIPKEVHDAYFKEQSHMWDKVFQGKGEGGFKGIIPTILEDEYVIEPMTQKSFSEAMANLFKMGEDKRKAEEEQDAKNKVLWDKHYKPYGLEYRK